MDTSDASTPPREPAAEPVPAAPAPEMGDQPGVSAEAAPVAAPSELNLARINEVFSQTMVDHLRVAPPVAEGRRTGDGPLEELADDMLELLRVTKAINEQEADVSGRLNGLGREVHEMREALLGERRAALSRQVLDAVAPAIDQLRQMRSSLSPKQKYDQRFAKQLDGMLAVLVSVLRRLGYEEFYAKKGDPFNPDDMVSIGEREGLPGMVLGCGYPGYRHDKSLARPAGVYTAPYRAGTPGAQ